MTAVAERIATRSYETETSEAFRNHDILLESGADPYVTRLDDGTYLYVTSGAMATELLVGWVETLADISRKSLLRIEFEVPPEASLNMWAPEVHQIDGELYIYYAADEGNINHHRMHVLRATNPFNPYSTWEYLGQMKTEHDQWAIDGTVLQTEDDNYFIWSGWEDEATREGSKEQRLYISRMVSPTEVEDTRARIASPELMWEQGEQGEMGHFKINEGPAILRNHGRTWCVYSASCSWTDEYCLGIMELVGDDPCVPEHWIKRPTPFFTQTENLYGPGHCSFTTDKEGGVYMLYHSLAASGAGWEGRQVRMTRVYFDDFGEPVVPPYIPTRDTIST